MQSTIQRRDLRLLLRLTSIKHEHTHCEGNNTNTRATRYSFGYFEMSDANANGL